MKTGMVLGTVLALASPAFADEGEDTLRFYLAKSDLVILGKIASAPNRASEEVGGVYYSCDFQIAEVLKGQKPAEDTIRVTIARFEREEADRLPELKHGSRCILFLKNAGDGKRVVWQTADLWFGVQRASPAMARSLRQLADGEKEGKLDETAALQGTWEVTQEIVDGKPVEYKGLGPGVKRTEQWVIAGRRITRRIELAEDGRAVTVLLGSVLRITRATATMDPHRLDLQAIGEGTPLSVEGKVYPAIYSVDGNTMKICKPNEVIRPTEFKAEAGSGRTLWVFKRVPGQPAEGPKLLAAGDWSKPVVDSRGAAVRGRLALYEKPRSDDRREVVVYVELQDASESRGRSLQLFCDFGKTNFRPEYKGGLDCDLRDKDGRPIPAITPFAFSGGVPGSQWITLPSDATIRLRATPFGIHRAKAIAISPHLGNVWVIGDDDPREYFLSGTFTVDPAADRTPPDGEHVWRGTIILPPARIVNQQK